MFLGTSKFPKGQVFTTLDREVLVRAETAEALQNAGLGEVLGEVLHARSKAPLPVFQLRSQAVLPRFSPATSGVVRERQCAACDRDGHFGIPNVPIVLHYAGLDSRLLESDVLATFERFGNSRLREPFSDSVFAAPLYVVSARFKSVLEASKVKRVDYQPVVIG